MQKQSLMIKNCKTECESENSIIIQANQLVFVLLYHYETYLADRHTVSLLQIISYMHLNQRKNLIQLESARSVDEEQ